MIETEVIGYTPNPNQRAARIAALANERESKGDALISVLSTPNCGAILVFRTPAAPEKK